MRGRIIGVMLGLFGVVATASAQCHPAWEASLGGGLSGAALAVSGSIPIGLVGRGTTLEVVDLTDAAHPALRGSVGLPASILDIGVEGSIAIVGCGGSNVCVVDVADPSKPSFVGSVRTATGVSQTLVYRQRAYVAIGAGGVSVIDVSHPSSPVVTQTVDLTGNVTQVARCGERLVVTESGFGLRVFDIGVDGSLTLSGGLGAGAPFVAAMDGDPNTLYLTSTGSAVVALNVENPSAIVERWRLTMATAPSRLRREGTLLFVNCGLFTGMVVIDIANAAQPRVLSTTQVGENPTAMTARGSNLFVVGSQAGASLISAADTARLSVLGRYDPLSFPEQVVLRGNYAFIAGGSGGRLDVVDVTDTARPRIVSYLDTFGLVPGVALQGDVAWVVDAGLLLRLDISVLPTMRLTDYAIPPDAAYRVAVENDMLFLACGTAGVAVYDQMLTQQALLDTPGDARDVATLGNAMLIADATGGALAVDISNPVAPIITGTFAAQGSTFNVYIITRNGARYGYATSTLGGMQILDLTDIQHPTRIGTLAAQERYYGMAAFGDRLYVAENNRGVRVLDLTNPAAPVPIDVADTPGLARGVAVDATRLVAADFTGGAQFGLREGRAPVVLDQPSSVNACPGRSVTLRVSASGGPFTTYHWRKNGAPIDATAPALRFERVQASDVGAYECVVSNSCGDSLSQPAEVRSCVADVDDGSGIGTCDGSANVDDLLWYLARFEAGDQRSDVDDGTSTGSPDGGVTIDDLLFYLVRFEAGC